MYLYLFKYYPMSHWRELPHLWLHNNSFSPSYINSNSVYYSFLSDIPKIIFLGLIPNPQQYHWERDVYGRLETVTTFQVFIYNSRIGEAGATIFGV